jgi:uncharacterized membrane protein YeaQ/YmgE (transglycosylase-associated protein family)
VGAVVGAFLLGLALATAMPSLGVALLIFAVLSAITLLIYRMRC